jgi:hypothetical protein
MPKAQKSVTKSQRRSKSSLSPPRSALKPLKAPNAPAKARRVGRKPSQLELEALAVRYVTAMAPEVGVGPADLYDPSMWHFTACHKAILNPGNYWVGDLCYVFDPALYHGVLGYDYGSGRYADGWYKHKTRGYEFFVGPTGGDGTFRGSDGRSYTVDAGIIGICSPQLVTEIPDHDEAGAWHRFGSQVFVDFMMGHRMLADDYKLRIKTGLWADNGADDYEFEDSQDEW